MLLLILSTACAGLFCGAALYVNFVEHPARMSCGPELALHEIAKKSVEKPLQYAGRLGIETKAKFPQTHKEVVQKELAAAGAGVGAD